MMRSLAHSARNGFPAQAYQDHVENVWRRATQYAAEVEQFAADSSGQLQKVVSWAGNAASETSDHLSEMYPYSGY